MSAIHHCSVPTDSAVYRQLRQQTDCIFRRFVHHQQRWQWQPLPDPETEARRLCEGAAAAATGANLTSWPAYHIAGAFLSPDDAYYRSPPLLYCTDERAAIVYLDRLIVRCVCVSV